MSIRILIVIMLIFWPTFLVSGLLLYGDSMTQGTLMKESI